MLMIMPARLCMYADLSECTGEILNSFTDTRGRMQHFWNAHSVEGSEKEMMLDDDAEVLGLDEIPELLSLHPELTGKDIIELGAGIGYIFTAFTIP